MLGLVLISRIDFPAPQPVARANGWPQLGRADAQPVFLVAVLASALGYGGHELADVATRSPWSQCGLPASATRTGCCSGMCWGCLCQLLHGCGDQTRGRDARAVGGRAAQPGHAWPWRSAARASNSSRWPARWAWAGTSSTWAAPRSSRRPTGPKNARPGPDGHLGLPDHDPDLGSPPARSSPPAALGLDERGQPAPSCWRGWHWPGSISSAEQAQ